MGGLRETANDLAVVLRRALEVRIRDDANPELGLDRVAVVGGPRELHLVDIRPPRALDGDDEALHRWPMMSDSGI